MAATERARQLYREEQPRYSGSGYEAYRAARQAYAYSDVATYGQPERQREQEKVRRTRLRPQRQQEQHASQGLTGAELGQLLVIAVFVGVLLISLLVLNAYAVKLQCNVNKLTKENIALEDEIDVLQMKIDGSTSIEQIESYAMDELHMRYPKTGQRIYISEDVRLRDDFADTIKSKVYHLADREE